MTQMKGDSETHPKLSPNDEFADYETWGKGNLTGSAAQTDDMLPGNYARSALKRGLKLGSSIGANPYQHGFIGSTDSHTSLATAGENNFFGKASMIEPGPERWKHVVIKSTVDEKLTTYASETTAAGLAAAWATENTRDALFEAMERRETYATTGPRITVRVFAGWDFVAEDLHRADFAEYGYSNGVPMGGDLAAAPAGQVPNFVIRTLRDPDGANLDRIQVIKGWLDKDGQTQERIYDVVCADNRAIKDRRCDNAVGSTVDVKAATYSNTIGEPLLFGHWTDPDFDPSLRAFYYVRVIEIPTPRWTAYEAMRFGIEMSKTVPMEHQERAYTSSIWYTP
jgi:hypothetical protein